MMISYCDRIDLNPLHPEFNKQWGVWFNFSKLHDVVISRQLPNDRLPIDTQYNIDDSVVYVVFEEVHLFD